MFNNEQLQMEEDKEESRQQRWKYHNEVLPENVTQYFMGQLVHVVFQLTGSAVAIPATTTAAAAAHHRLEVSGFLPGTHWHDAVHSEAHKPLCHHQQAALFL